MVDAISTAATAIFDLLLKPFGSHADLALAVVSLISGALLIVIFRVTSDQARIRRTRQRFQAHILEIRIYADDPVQIVKAFGEALWDNLVHLRLMLVPLLVAGLVVAVIYVQLDARFGHSALVVGEATLVTVTYRAGTDVMSDDLSLATDDGARVDAPPVRVPAERQVNWRVRVTRAGRPGLALGVEGAHCPFMVAASPGTGVVGVERSRSSIDRLVHPGLPTLPGHVPIDRITIRYPPAEHGLIAWRTHWLFAFALWSLVGALVSRALLGVEL